MKRIFTYFCHGLLTKKENKKKLISPTDQILYTITRSIGLHVHSKTNNLNNFENYGIIFYLVIPTYYLLSALYSVHLT